MIIPSLHFPGELQVILNIHIYKTVNHFQHHLSLRFLDSLSFMYHSCWYLVLNLILSLLSFVINPSMFSDVDWCRLWGFVFANKRTKQNIIGEFEEWFEKGISVEILEVVNGQCVTWIDIESRNHGRVGSLSRNNCEKESTQFCHCMTSTRWNNEPDQFRTVSSRERSWAID